MAWWNCRSRTYALVHPHVIPPASPLTSMTKGVRACVEKTDTHMYMWNAGGYIYIYICICKLSMYYICTHSIRKVVTWGTYTNTHGPNCISLVQASNTLHNKRNNVTKSITSTTNDLLVCVFKTIIVSSSGVCPSVVFTICYALVTDAYIKRMSCTSHTWAMYRCYNLNKYCNCDMSKRPPPITTRRHPNIMFAICYITRTLWYQMRCNNLYNMLGLTMFAFEYMHILYL